MGDFMPDKPDFMFSYEGLIWYGKSSASKFYGSKRHTASPTFGGIKYFCPTRLEYFYVKNICHNIWFPGNSADLGLRKKASSIIVFHSSLTSQSTKTNIRNVFWSSKAVSVCVGQSKQIFSKNPKINPPYDKYLSILSWMTWQGQSGHNQHSGAARRFLPLKAHFIVIPPLIVVSYKKHCKRLSFTSVNKAESTIPSALTGTVCSLYMYVYRELLIYLQMWSI